MLVSVLAVGVSVDSELESVLMFGLESGVGTSEWDSVLISMSKPVLIQSWNRCRLPSGVGAAVAPGLVSITSRSG